MTVYLLMYVPYGCPAGDVDVKGVYTTEAQAVHERERMIAEDYDGNETYIVEQKVDVPVDL